MNLIKHNRCAKSTLVLFFALATCACAAQQSANSLTQREKSMEDKKQQILGFLGRLKTALDLNAIRDPQRLQEVTGFEVLEWSTMLTDPSYRSAQRWRYNISAMDQTPEMLAGAQLYRSGYGVSDKTSQMGGLSIGGFPEVTCVTPTEIDQIFGAARIEYRMRTKPYHGPWVAPFRDANSYLMDSKTQSLITFTYNYEDEKTPKATCLKELKVRFGAKPPAGY